MEEEVFFDEEVALDEEEEEEEGVRGSNRNWALAEALLKSEICGGEVGESGREAEKMG